MFITIKRFLVYFFLLYTGTIYAVLNNEIIELRSRLDRVSSFYAKFIQKISNSQNVILQESQGKIWVQHPNLFKIHTISPDENMLISNGETLWFYDNCTDQVTISWLMDVCDKTMFIFFSNTSSLEWNKYYVNQIQDDFHLTVKKEAQSFLKKIIIKITCTGIIKSVSFLDKEHLYINYQLFDHIIDQPYTIDHFIFSPSGDSIIDDQR